MLDFHHGLLAEMAAQAHSLRSAAAGSICVARHAGAAIASAAVRASTTATATNVTGSSGSTPNSSVATRRLSTTDRTRPMTAPAPITRIALSSDEAKHVPRCRAQRPAHAEVAHALLHGIGEDAEHADHRQQQRQGGKRHHQHRAESMTRGRVPRDIVERHHVR